MFPPALPSHSGAELVTSHTARFRSRGVPAPIHQKLCLPPAAPSQSPIFHRFSRSRPKTTLACDILCPIMFATILTPCSRLGTDQTPPWVTHSQSCSGSLPAAVAVSAASARHQQHPSKPTTAKSFAPIPSPCQLSAPFQHHYPPVISRYWPNWPRSAQEIDASAGCQRSDLWATQNAWTPGPGVWFAVDLQWPFFQKRIHFFSDLQTIVSERPCSPVEPSCR